MRRPRGDLLVRAACLRERVGARRSRPRARRLATAPSSSAIPARSSSRAPEQVHEPEADHCAAGPHQVDVSNLHRLARGESVRDQATERSQRRQARLERFAARSSRARRPPALPALASRIAASRSSARESTAASAPRRSASSRLSSDDARAITRPAPMRFASCTASEPVPPRRGLDDHRLAVLEPGGSRGAGCVP